MWHELIEDHQRLIDSEREREGERRLLATPPSLRSLPTTQAPAGLMLPPNPAPSHCNPLISSTAATGHMLSLPSLLSTGSFCLLLRLLHLWAPSSTSAVVLRLSCHLSFSTVSALPAFVLFVAPARRANFLMRDQGLGKRATPSHTHFLTHIHTHTFTHAARARGAACRESRTVVLNGQIH